ncbi:MAG TPA: FAD-dependent monooxygenase [Pirellulales bacterium]|nr:FAD-dependent monooxygenase [Pirellulales bacterium]
MDDQQYDALVVGAGPTGLTMAIELARHGLRPRIIDKSPQPSQTSKALAVHARTLEFFDRIGIADQALAEGRKLHGINVHSQRQRIVHLNFDQIESRFNFVLVLPQSTTERLLAEKVTSLGVPIERGVELVGFHQQSTAVEATLRHVADGREETVRAAWLLGCDGAHSQVRHTLNTPFHGHAFEETFSLADAKLAANLPDDEISIFLSSGDILALFPMPGDRRFRVVIERHQGPPVQGEPSLDEFQRTLNEHVPGGQLSDPGWMSHFRISQRQVESYRLGHAFLAGDAAHIHSPMGGQGMNTGIQDAVNLAWKIALVHAGRAGEKILESYDAERRPVGRSLLQATGAMSQIVLLRHPVADKLRDWTASLLTSLDVVQDKIRSSLSELGINYRTSPIVEEQRPSDWRSAVTSWWDSGLRAGDRAPDASGLRTADGKELRLFDLFSVTQHVLLLFAAGEGDEAAVRSRQQRISEVARRYQGIVRHYTIVPPDGKAAAASHDSTTIVDVVGELHRAYGVRDEVLFLVRPDGYLAYRGEPADPGKLGAFLARLFKPDAQAPAG